MSFTNIYHYLGRDFYRPDSTGQGPFPRTTEFKIWDVREGVVYLSLEETGIKHKISVWIDLEYRRITKATLDGQQTWPEKPLGTERWREDYVRPRWRSVEHAKVVWILDLEFRYRDLRGEGKAPQDFMRSERFAQLMREWTPINCTAKDLKTVAGKPTRETKEFLEYQFDNDSGQARWRFTTTSNGTIRGVEFTPEE